MVLSACSPYFKALLEENPAKHPIIILKDVPFNHLTAILEDDDWVFGRVLFQEGLEVGRAGRQNHLVGLTSLSVAGQGDVSERLLVSEVFEGRHHVGLEVVPSQAKLLLIAGHCEVFLVGG